MKMLLPAVLVSGFLSLSAFASEPLLNCVSEDGVKRVRVKKGPFNNDMVAQVFHNEAPLKVLKCTKEPGFEEFLYRCGKVIRNPEGVKEIDTTDSVFTIKKEDFQPYSISEALYVGWNSNRTLICRHRLGPLD